MNPRAPLLVLLSSLAAAPVRAEWFYLARPEAVLEMRAEEGQTRQRTGPFEAQRREQHVQQRLRLDTLGHLYDERFLAYSLGLGLGLAQSRTDGPASRRARNLDDEYQARISLMPKHAVSGAASLERGRSTAHNVFAGRTRLERSFLRGALNLNRADFPASASFWSSRLTGAGASQPFEQLSQGMQWLAAAKPSERWSASLRQNYERFQEAESGGYDYRASALSLESTPRERLRLHSQGRVENRSGKLDMSLAGIESGADFVGKTLKTGARYGFERKQTDAQRTARQSVSAQGEHRLLESLTSGLSGNLEWNREAAGASRSRTLRLQEDYIKRIWGPLRFGAHWNGSLRWTDSRFDSLLSAVLDEPLELKDGAAAFLAREGADPESVAVFSKDRLRRYREGSDYELLRHGSLVELRRVITGDIADGESVLVNYQHAAAGRRRTRDSSRGARLSLLLGSRGSFWFSESRQSQKLLEASAEGLAPNSESFRERGWGVDLRWKFFGASQSWRRRDSSLAPLRSFRSALRAGGSVAPGLSVLLGWSYDTSRFPSSETRSLGRSYSIETRWSPAAKLDLSGEARVGDTRTAGLAGRYRSIGGGLSWQFRSFDAELSDRFTWRVVGGALSAENLMMIKLMRRL